MINTGDSRRLFLHLEWSRMQLPTYNLHDSKLHCDRLSWYTTDCHTSHLVKLSNKLLPVSSLCCSQCDTWHAHATLSHCLDTTLPVGTEFENFAHVKLYEEEKCWVSIPALTSMIVMNSYKSNAGAWFKTGPSAVVKVLFSSIVSLNHSIYFLETNLFKHASLKNPWASRSKLAYCKEFGDKWMRP